MLIAHLSDVHLPGTPRARLVDLSLKRGLGLLNWHRKRRHAHHASVLEAIVADVMAHRPDHIAVTGDLVNVGLPHEYAEALAWLETLGTPDRVSLVPGNHDAYGVRALERGIASWRAYMAGDLGPGARGTVGAAATGSAEFPFVRRRGRVALIGLSSGVPTPPFFAGGRLGTGQLVRLATRLAELGREGLARVVLIHHPPLPGQASWGRDLREVKELADVLRSSGAELVLHGHNHRPMHACLTTAEGRLCHVLGVPSASAGPPGHWPHARWSLLDLGPVSSGRWRIEVTSRGLLETGHIGTIERHSLET